MARKVYLEAPHLNNSYYNDKRIYTRDELDRKLIFVFGSNLAGIHGKGAAKEAAIYYGAIYGIPNGIVGSSYAIPTKGKHIERISIKRIEPYIKQFVEYTQMSKVGFFVTQVGCGLAGHHAKDIAPLFKGAKNCWFPQSWKKYIEEKGKENDGE